MRDKGTKLKVRSFVSMIFWKSVVEWVCTCLIPASVRLSPSALTEPSECDSIENAPRFQTLRFNVQAHQSRPVIYWLKLRLCISHQDRSRCPRLPEGHSAAGYPGPRREPGGSVAPLLEGIRRNEETLTETLRTSLRLVHCLTRLVTWVLIRETSCL